MLGAAITVGLVLSGPISFELKDELAGTETRYVLFQADDYRAHTNESEVKVTCSPEGEIAINAHILGRRLGSYYSKFDYRVDDGDVKTFDGSAEAELEILEEFEEGNEFIFRVLPGFTHRVSLAGSKVALSGVREQCIQPQIRRAKDTAIARQEERSTAEELGSSFSCQDIGKDYCQNAKGEFGYW